MGGSKTVPDPPDRHALEGGGACASAAPVAMPLSADTPRLRDGWRAALLISKYSRKNEAIVWALKGKTHLFSLN